MAKKKPSEKLLKKILHVNSMIYIGLYVLEMKIRQSIPLTFQSVLGKDWLLNELTAPNVPLFIQEIELIRRRHSQQYAPTEEKFIREASLGFWVELFNPETYKLLKGAPIKAFAYRPPAFKRRNIYRIFKDVKDLRNEIVHGRMPSDLKKEAGKTQLKKLQQANTDIRLLISYIDPSALQLLPKNFEKKVKEAEALFN